MRVPQQRLLVVELPHAPESLPDRLPRRGQKAARGPIHPSSPKSRKTPGRIRERKPDGACPSSIAKSRRVRAFFPTCDLDSRIKGRWELPPWTEELGEQPDRVPRYDSRGRASTGASDVKR